MAIYDNCQVLMSLAIMCKQLSSYWQSGLTVLLQRAAKEWSCRAWNSGWPCAHTCLDAILCLLLWVSIVGIVRLVCTWSQERLSQGTYSLRYATGISCLIDSVWQKPTTVLSEGIEPLPIASLSLSPSSFCFCSMLQSELPGAICLQCFWCTVTRALCRVLLERKKMLD